jgi:hypothetical protein
MREASQGSAAHTQGARGAGKAFNDTDAAGRICREDPPRAARRHPALPPQTDVFLHGMVRLQITSVSEKGAVHRLRTFDFSGNTRSRNEVTVARYAATLRHSESRSKFDGGKPCLWRVSSRPRSSSRGDYGLRSSDPDLPAAESALGRAYLHPGDHHAAVLHLGRAVDLGDPSIFISWRRRMVS